MYIGSFFIRLIMFPKANC